MLEENREHLPETDEVVRWYVRPEGGREVTDLYVQSRPMPEKAMPAPPPGKKSRRGLWIFLTVLAVLTGVVIGGAIVSALQSAPETWDGGQDDASSIVNITQSDVPAIPRAAAAEGLRFYTAPAAEETLSAQEVYAAVNPATVLVVADLGEKASIGSGLLLTEDGYFVTNAHVIAGATSAFIALSTGDTCEAELVGFDSSEDLALMKAVNVSGLPTASLADSNYCAVGDTVYAIGNPLGVELRGTLTDGIISAIDRRVTMDGNVMTLLQTTAALNNGNSGGPLIDRFGQVIGINTLKMSGTGSGRNAASVEALGFAVPSDRVVAVLNDIAATGAFHGIPSVGIYVQELEQPDGTIRPVVDSVTEGFGAEEAGLQPGDVLLAADGMELHRNTDLLAVRRRHIVGETMVLTLRRGTETLDITVYLYPAEE